MRKPAKVARELTQDDFKYINQPNKMPSKMYVVNQRCGKTYLQHDIITIPKWAEDRGLPYFSYYIAHELSHITGRTSLHNNKFYKAFKAICPKSLQHFELGYKKNAVAYGIAKH